MSTTGSMSGAAASSIGVADDGRVVSYPGGVLTLASTSADWLTG